MNTRKWVGLFIRTLIVGGTFSLLASFFVNSGEYIDTFKPFDFLNLSGLLVWYIIYGFLFSVVSQAGFFAYMFINQFGLNLFRSLWPTVQLLLVAFVVFDLVYFPYQGMDKEIPLYLFILMSGAILVYSLLIARIKAQQTHRRAFVPALFFMVVLTAIEWVPGLRTGEVDYALLMIITLLACNTYQILRLHHLTRDDQGKEYEKNTKHSKNLRKTKYSKNL